MTITGELFFDTALIPFHACVIAIFILTIIETIGIYIKHRPSHYFRQLIPLWIRNSPVLQVQISRFIILVFFLINLSFAGYFFQLSFYAFNQEFMSSGLVFIPAFLMAWFFTLFMMHCLDQVIKPSDFSCPISLIGRMATVTGGSARPHQTATAIVRDAIGQLHYVAVEPEYGEIEQNAHVVLMRYSSEAHYIVKKIPAQQPISG